MLSTDSFSFWLFGHSIKVGRRHRSKKTEAKGLFPGAKVERGPDWKYKDQDGGSGKEGDVSKITYWRDKQRSAATVCWNHAKKGNYRVGFMGKVGVKCALCLTPHYIMLCFATIFFPFSHSPSRVSVTSYSISAIARLKVKNRT